MNNNGGLGPTEVARTPPQSGGGGCAAAETEQTSALQVTLWLCGAHKENTKNEGNMGLP